MQDIQNKYKKPYYWGHIEKYPRKLWAYLDYKKSPKNIYVYSCLKWPEDLPKPIENSFGIVFSPPYKYYFNVKGNAEDLLKYDCLRDMASAPIVNKRVQDLITTLCGDDIQFLDVEIKTKDTVLTSEYKLVNILTKVDVIDMEESDYWIDDEIYYQFRKVYFNKNSMEGHHIARDRYEDHLVVVSEELKEVFQKNKIKGSNFKTDEQAYSLISGTVEFIAGYFKNNPKMALGNLTYKLDSKRNYFMLKRKINHFPLHVLETLVPQIQVEELSEEGQKNLEDFKKLVEERRKNEILGS